MLSEEGEIALVAATPGQFTEIARHPAIDHVQDLAVIVVVRHISTGYGYNNDMWAKYGATLAEALDYAASGSRGMNFHDARGRLVRSYPYSELKADALAERVQMLGGISVGDLLPARVDAGQVAGVDACGRHDATDPQLRYPITCGAPSRLGQLWRTRSRLAPMPPDVTMTLTFCRTNSAAIAGSRS